MAAKEVIINTAATKQLVDDYAQAKADMAAAESVADKISAKLKARGLGRYTGTLHDANVFERSITTVDWEGIAHALGFDPTSAKGRRQLKKFRATANQLCLKLTGRVKEE